MKYFWSCLSNVLSGPVTNFHMEHEDSNLLSGKDSFKNMQNQVGFPLGFQGNREDTAIKQIIRD